MSMSLTWLHRITDSSEYKCNECEMRFVNDRELIVHKTSSPQVDQSFIGIPSLPDKYAPVKPGRPTNATNGWTYFFGTTAADLPIAA